MENLGDDVLASIMIRVHDSASRRSISQVCKQWLRIEGLTRSSVRVFDPNLLLNFLPRFPNLQKFDTSEKITNAHLEILAENVPGSKFLTLISRKKTDFTMKGMKV